MQNSRNGYKFNIKADSDLQDYLIEHTNNASKSCTLLWFIDEDGKTKLWTGEIKDSYSLRYQVNEEEDQCHIVLLSFLNHETVFSRKIKNLTKVIVMHNATITNYLPTFDDKGKPLNHDQYVIVSGTCSLRQGNGYYYEHDYTLAEPLYTLRYWATETQTITNMTSITISQLENDVMQTITYHQEETNLYYVLKRMLQITGYKTSVEDCSLDTLISIQDKRLLSNACKGINDNFMASNFYQNLMKMAKYLDRLPVLYFNPNYEIQDSNNLNESKKEYLLFFEKKETNNVYTEDEVFTDISGYCECELATKDAGTVVVDAQNLVSSTPIWYPGYGYFCAATGDRGKITFEATDYVSIKLPTAIDKVLNVKVIKMLTDLSSILGPNFKDETIEVPCIEYQQWINIADAEERKKYFYYKKYGNVIEINHTDYKFIRENNKIYTQFFYSVQYIPLIDARIKMTASNKLETSITQVESTLDSKAYGTYLNNYAKENCNIDYSLARTYFDFDKILKPGDAVDMNNGGRLIVASTDVTRKNNSYYVIYVLNEYRVKRSSLISASNLIDNKIINKESSMKRFVNLNEKTIKVGINIKQSNNELNLNYIQNSEIVVNGYLGTSPELDYYPNIAFIKFDNQFNESKYFSLNIHKTQVGKSILYNISTEDSTILYGGGLFGDTSNNTYSRYSDAFGKIKKISIIVSDFKAGYTNVFNLVVGFPGIIDNEEFSETRNDILNFVKTYPLITNTEYNEKILNSPIKINDLILLKDTNEIFNLSFQINFQEEDKDTIIFDRFIEINRLIYNGSDKDSNDDYISFAIIVIDSQFKITEEVEDLNELIDLKYIYVKSISPEAVSDNCLKINEGDLNQRIPKGSQIVLLQIISRSADEEIIKDYEFVGSPKNIYPLIAKTIRTDEYDNTEINKEFYLEFSN